MNWSFKVKRQLSLLFCELINQGDIKKNMKKYLGVDFGFDNYRAVEWNVYYNQDEIDTAERMIKDIYFKEGSDFFKVMINKWELFMKNLEKLSLEIYKKKYSMYSKEELIVELDKLSDAYKLASTALYAPILIEALADDIIKKKLKLYESDKAKNYFNILTTSEKDNESTKEIRSLLEIAIKSKKGENIDSDVDRHIESFGWINTRGFLGDVWSKKEILERVDFVLKKNPDARLNALNNHIEHVKRDTQKVFSDIKANESFRDFVAITKEYVFFRTYRMDMFVKCGFLARPLFREIAKRLNFDLEDLWYLLTNEIKQAFLSNKNFRSVIEERKKGFCYIKNKNKNIALSGKKLEDYKKKNVKEELSDKSDVIKGVVACPGKVKGIVKIVSVKEDIDKIEVGDIMVASMTTPDFIVGMEKAAAFVTDEGGILCHAAIVSREMKKPCIIGTNIASKILKDGFLVEVDADKGFVKIIKRK